MSKTKSQLQAEKIAIARHLVHCREQQVARHGDLFATELASARQSLARAERGEFHAPSNVVERGAHEVAYRSAYLLGFAD